MGVAVGAGVGVAVGASVGVGVGLVHATAIAVSARMSTAIRFMYIFLCVLGMGSHAPGKRTAGSVAAVHYSRTAAAHGRGDGPAQRKALYPLSSVDRR